LPPITLGPSESQATKPCLGFWPSGLQRPLDAAGGVDLGVQGRGQKLLVENLSTFDPPFGEGKVQGRELFDPHPGLGPWHSAKLVQAWL